MNNVSFCGNLVRDPELKFSGDKPRALFTVAVNEGQGDDEKTHFVDVTAFGTLGENLVNSLKKGTRVLVIGRMSTYKTDVQINGDEKSITRVAFTASAIGPDLRWATASVSKVSNDSSNGSNGGGGNRGNDGGERGGQSEQSGRTSGSSNRGGNGSSANQSDDF